MILKKLTKNVEWHLYREARIRELVRERRSEHIMEHRPGDIKKNPTENEAVRNLSEVEAVRSSGVIIYHPERWLAVMDKLYSSLGGVLYKLAVARYRHNEEYTDTCRRLEISKNKYFLLLGEIRILGVIYAVEAGLLKTG